MSTSFHSERISEEKNQKEKSSHGGHGVHGGETQPVGAVDRRLENHAPPAAKELCKRYLPRKIHDDAEDQQATAVVDALAGDDLNQDQEDYLDLVSDLVDEYDRATRRQPKEASPIDVLKLLLEQHKVSARELSRPNQFRTEATVDTERLKPSH